MNSSDVTSELESFREQWRAEVRAKMPGSRSDAQPGPSGASAGSSQGPARATTEFLRKPGKENKPLQDDGGDVEPPTFDDEPGPEPAASSSMGHVIEPGERSRKEPVTALEHYEKAVEREIAGNLGDSLRLYRAAFRVRPSALHVALSLYGN